jgi:GT2 family glycosyltransferase
MAPRFSVLLPTHNRADVLGFAISSVLSQTLSDFELLVVGDGCTDNTADVVASFRDSRIRWFDLPKAPYFGYANRNVALKQAAGEFIAFMAHDDLVFPDHLAVLAAALERPGIEWVYSRPLWVTTDGLVVPFASNLRNADELETFLSVRNHIPASCVLHRRSCFEKYGYWPEDVPAGADWRYWIRVIEGGNRTNLDYCSTPTVLHFHAIWKTSQIFQATAAQEIANRGSWWPPALKVAIAPGAIEQKVFHDLIRSEGYVERLRTEVGRVVDRLAWMQLDESPQVLPGLREEAARLAALERQLTATRAELEAERTRLDAVHASTSWRLTAPLRALRRLAGGRAG